VSTPWWAAFPPVRVIMLTCDDHDLRWEQGKLVATEHPEIESELARGALGGRLKHCVKLVRNWDLYSKDPEVLALGPRTMKDKLSLPVTDPRSEPRPHAELLELFRLGHKFALRLTAAAALAPHAEPVLTAALTGRLAPVAASWLGIDPGDVDARIHYGDGWGELELSSTGRLRAALPASWLASVWAPGLALIDGKLVVAVTKANWPKAEVLALTRLGGVPRSMRARCSVFGRWRMIRS